LSNYKKRLQNEPVHSGDAATLAAIVAVLRGADVAFIDENGGGPGVRLRKRQQQRP
jgi:hypothetical protein